MRRMYEFRNPNKIKVLLKRLCARCEVLTEVLVKIKDFWDLNAFTPVKS